MILSRSSEYALMVMAYITCHSNQGPLRSRDISHNVKVPPSYVSKILRKMVEAELLLAEKGHGGGFTLAREPAKIYFQDIFEAIEGDLQPSRCVFGWRECNEKKPCILHHRWKEAKDSFYSWAAKTTLADVQKDIRKYHVELPPLNWSD